MEAILKQATEEMKTGAWAPVSVLPIETAAYLL
jgi:hypothetical protein